MPPLPNSAETTLLRTQIEACAIHMLDSWQSHKGLVHSFTKLTLNADVHELMCQFHKSVDERRMVVILPPKRYDDWLGATPEQSMEFMRQYPANLLGRFQEVLRHARFMRPNSPGKADKA